jgi:integrase/recombinase XerC
MFISCNGRRLAGSDIFRILKSYADLAEVPISPHRVRHSAITSYLDASDGNIRVAQSLSRHKDPRTLMVYDDNRQQLQRQATRELGDLLDVVVDYSETIFPSSICTIRSATSRMRLS